MHGDIPLFNLPIGPGSQSEEEQLNYLPMPHEMHVFETPVLPEPEALDEDPEVLALLAHLQQALAVCRVGQPGRIVELDGLSDTALRLLHQILGEGEVAVQIRGPQAARIQETVLAGVWWVMLADTDGRPHRQWLEVADIPGLVPAVAFAEARWPTIPAADSLPGNLLNAAPVLVELLDVARSHAAQPRATAHVINLSLLPFSPEDQRFLAAQLGEGAVVVLSRGYGNCRIASTATPGIWRVQYFNSTDQLILDTLEVIGVPQVACAAREDLEDSAERLADIRGALL